ncbi:MAG: hypothetical protein K2P89_01095, partial [Lachnospiraceae bacterium]|jgi:hypothetical protein|nr:hypothetical protein [Lachnospiraceae bacterium]
MQHHAAWAFIIVDMMGENTDYADVLEVGSAGIGDVDQRFSHDRISENERVKYERYGMRYV